MKNKILKCQTELLLLFDITFDSMNTDFSGVFQQNMFSILESWSHGWPLITEPPVTIGADICKYIEVPLRLNYPCNLQTLYGALSNKVPYTYINKVWDVIFNIKTV